VCRARGHPRRPPARSTTLSRRRRRLRGHGCQGGVCGRSRARGGCNGAPSRVPALRRARAARLPSLPAGRPGARRARTGAGSYPRRRHDRTARGDGATPARARRRRGRSFSRTRRAPRPRLSPPPAGRRGAPQGLMGSRHLHRLAHRRCRQRLGRIPLDGRNPAVYPAAHRGGSAPDRIARAFEGAAGLSKSDAASMTTIEAPKGAARCKPRWRTAALLLTAVLAPQVATAQDKGTLNPQPLPPLVKPDDPATPAKELFGRKTAPANLQTRTIGFYSKGCLAGAMALPINGATWQVMRLSRNRNWGHPNLVQFLERLSDQGHKIGWNGLLVGDMSQPRGGPMLSGHASHQVGLDADIWRTPMPTRELSRVEREELLSTMVVAADRRDVDPQIWTPAHVNLIKAAAKDSQVARIFVNAAIKKALCRDAGNDRHWLGKVQPWWGH